MTLIHRRTEGYTLWRLRNEADTYELIYSILDCESKRWLGGFIETIDPTQPLGDNEKAVNFLQAHLKEQ